MNIQREIEKDLKIKKVWKNIQNGKMRKANLNFIEFADVNKQTPSEYIINSMIISRIFQNDVKQLNKFNKVMKRNKIGISEGLNIPVNKVEMLREVLDT